MPTVLFASAQQTAVEGFADSATEGDGVYTEDAAKNLIPFSFIKDANEQ